MYSCFNSRIGPKCYLGRSENLTSIRWSDWNKQGGCFAVTGRNQYNEDKISDYTAEFDLHTDLILSENLYENGIHIAKYIVEVSVDEENKIPECYVDNGAMLIFVGVDNGGWYVDTDTSLQLNFQQKRVDMKGMETAGVLEVGYVYNGRVKWCQVTDNINSNIQLLFEEEGNYYICLRNASSDRIIITNGSINIKKTQEE